MKISKQSRRVAKQLFRGTQLNGRIDENLARRTVRAVLETKPRGYLAILSHFQRLLKLDIERRTGRVESATPLPSPYQDQLKSNLTRIYGDQLTLTFSQNPALIGGVRVRVGNDVYDGSIQARLEKLQEAF
jgi:F-type H+-transporting ATPase subunit delta